MSIDYHRPRYKCQACGQTFSARRGTMLEGLRTDEEGDQSGDVTGLWTPTSSDQAFGLDERTIAAWQKRSGKHCQHVHTRLMEHGQVKSQHIQADEIRAKGRKLIVWMAFAMDVSTRLWRRAF